MKFATCSTWGTTLALLLVLNCPLRAAPARIVFVNRNATGVVHDGRSWATAYLTLQAAVDASVNGDELWVAASRPAAPAYTGKTSVTLALAIYGGFAGMETKRTQRDWKRNITVLDGNKSGPVITLETAASQPVVLDGFTVRNGQQTGYGGGVYVRAPAALIVNNTIVDNVDYGIFQVSGHVTVTGNTISRNTSVGLRLQQAAVISNNTICGNGYDGVYGGSAVSLTNNTICGNSQNGLKNAYGTYRCVNNVIAHNGANGVFKEANASFAAFSHNDVYGNTQGEYRGYTPPTDLGNISADPLLSSRYHTVHLQPGSPCIDAGDDASVATGDTDLYGKPRIIGAHVDIGADESDGTTWAVPVRTLRVTPTGSDDSDGLTWSRAKKTIAGALAVAQAPNEVWVAAGTYVEAISMPPGVAVYGGFAGTETDRSARNPAANPTILDGNGAQRVLTCGMLGAAVDGLTVRNGLSGALVSGSAMLTNVRITGNSGGGIRVANGTLTMSRCEVSDNGGTLGVFVSPGTAVLTSNTIRANNGDAVYVQASNLAWPYQTAAWLRGNLIVGNGGRGLVVSSACTAKVTGDTICGNKGEGLLLHVGATTSVTNAILGFNSGYGVTGATSTTLPVFSHNNVYGNRGGTGDGLPTTAIACLKADPLFVDRTSGDYHLQIGSPCIDAGADSAIDPEERDIDGHSRLRGSHVDIGALEYADPTARVSISAAVLTPATLADGVAYVGAATGQLYAFTSPSLNPVPEFPVDIRAAVGASVKLNTRPAVYYGKGGKAVYLTTNLGHVVKVRPDGTVAWATKPLNGPTMSTPSVTPDGSVYTSFGLGTTEVVSYLLRLDEINGVVAFASPSLGSSSADALTNRSPAVDLRYAFVNTAGVSIGALAVLNRDDLTVRASFAPGEDALEPYLKGQNVYVATVSGSVYKVNAITMSPDLLFGTLGEAAIGEPITAGPFLDSIGRVYVGTASGNIWTVDGDTGAKTLFAGSGPNSAVTGLLVTRTIVAFGTADGTFQQAFVSDPTLSSIESLIGSPIGAPVFDPINHRFIVTTDSGRMYSVPNL